MKNSVKKLTWISILCIAVLVAVSVWFQWQQGNDVQQALADTRQALRQQGFKTDLADFNFSTDDNARAREAALIAFNTPLQFDTSGARLNLMPVTDDNDVIIVWKLDWLKTDYSKVSWSDLQAALDGNRWVLDDACAAALSGPIRFNLDASGGSAMLLRHLAPLRNLSLTLGSREMVELHENNPEAAWTNLLAVTRLVTAWEPEPTEISQLVRFGLVTFAFNDTWQALQYHAWPEAKLVELQHEWEALDLFTNLPETAAFRRASVAAMCQQEREQPLSGGISFPDLIKTAIRSPAEAYSDIKVAFTQARYRGYGTFDDERNLLLFFQNREREIRQAIQSPTWVKMQQLPGVTNRVLFQSKHRSRLQSLMNLQEMGIAVQRRFTSFLGRAAEAEARRRILITAIALERYRGRHDAYPATLAVLVPEFLKSVPVDFMDGQPLRYQLMGDGHFMLYSVGLNCVDDGGKIQTRTQRIRNNREGLPPGMRHEADLVWPRPAAAAAAEAYQMQASRAEELQRQDQLEDLSEVEWNRSSLRQSRTEKILAMKWSPGSASFRGQPVVDIVSNDKASGTNRLTLGQLLTPRQIITGSEPEDITFQLPVSYDVIASQGSLRLLLDAEPNVEGTFAGDSGARMQECNRAANGDCLLVWHTIYDPPGRHAVQVELTLTSGGGDESYFQGPPAAITTSNLCQFSLDSSTYSVERGATFHARLPEANGLYDIECLTTNGEHLATLSGSTTNGEFEKIWNLVDERGHRLTGETFNSMVHITLPDSGRTQTLRGP